MRTLSMLVLATGLASAVAHADKVKGPKPGAAKKAVIEIKEVTVNFDGNPIARMRADGTTESVGPNKPGKDAKFEPGPTFHANGTIDLKAGYKARVDAKGDIYVVSPASTKKADERFGHIDGDKIVFAAEGGLELDRTKVKLISNGRWTELGEVSPQQMGHTALLMATALYIEMGINNPTP